MLRHALNPAVLCENVGHLFVFRVQTHAAPFPVRIIPFERGIAAYQGNDNISLVGGILLFTTTISPGSIPASTIE